jgi:hypothetical protein
MAPIARQKVYIANFGHENYLWNDCRDHDTIGMFQSEDLQPFWLAQDREGYVAHGIAIRKTAGGNVMTPTVAGRWFNLGTEFFATSGDVWIHHDEGALWWTISKADEVTTTLEPAGPGRPAGEMVYVLRKPARRWSRANEKGAVLAWDGLHARAGGALCPHRPRDAADRQRGGRPALLLARSQGQRRALRAGEPSGGVPLR